MKRIGCYAYFVQSITNVYTLKIGYTQKEGESVMAKLKELNLNLDVSVIPPLVIDGFLLKEPTDEQKKEYQKDLKAWASKPEAERGERPEIPKEYKTGAEFVVDVIGQAITQAHPNGNIQVLRRTKQITAELEGAIESDEKKGVVLLQPDDHKYIVSAYAKADKWVNNPANAIVLVAIAELIDKAKDVEL